jgi:uncharacterized protein YbbC (DUF1343 family)
MRRTFTALFFTFLWLLALGGSPAAFASNRLADSQLVLTGAAQVSEYLPAIIGKKLALVVNQTSVVGRTHLVDTLISLDQHIQKIFAPEHGFRGTADAGEKIENTRDAKTGLPIVSLYGKNFKPTADQLVGVDVVIYDIQDVGVRFYTYVSTLHYVAEACAESGVELLVLDRPNPNGFYVDGPILDSAFRSFVGVDPVPVVYGLTPAEYVRMLVGEAWINDAAKLKWRFVTCKNYSHSTLYSLPVNPSPNLRTMTAIYLYPSVCLFEGTQVSVGRGTEKPFMLVGYPDFGMGNIKFTPKSMPGAKNPPYNGEECLGFDLSGLNSGFFVSRKRLFLQWLMECYHHYPEKQKFFTDYFNTLAGNGLLKEQIIQGKTEQEIFRSWEPELSEFKKKRKKYLLYEDFEP